MKIKRAILLADVGEMKNKLKNCIYPQQYVTAKLWEGTRPYIKTPVTCNGPLTHIHVRDVLLQYSVPSLVPETYQKFIFDMIGDLKDDTVLFDITKPEVFGVSEVKNYRPYVSMIVWRWLHKHPVTAMYCAYLKSWGWSTYDVLYVIQALSGYDPYINSSDWHLNHNTYPVPLESFVKTLDTKPTQKYNLFITQGEIPKKFQDALNAAHQNLRVVVKTHSVHTPEYREAYKKYTDMSPITVGAAIIKEDGFSIKTCRKILNAIT